MSTGCSIALLESALAGNLPADDEAALNQHLEECKQCGAALERMAGGPAWCLEAAAALLAGDELDAALPTREEWSEVDFTVENLEPTDEPNVLGRLGGYDVLEIIGRGGMGVVLKAFDRELKRCVAIKVLAPHLAQSSLAKKRFAREAQAAAAIVHPNVLAIHQVQPNGRLPFLVMPLLAGESLAQRLTAQGRLELKETLRIGMQAAAGLTAAHEQGLVHRDVKPANILLEKGVERAVLTDFGLARAADDVTLTRWGIIAGTPQYMSPEQARGEPLDGRSDLFSLGCVLYEMATGVSPFRTDSMMATMRRLVDDPPQAMASLNPELPPWFIAMVDRLLEKDPSRRFGSAKEVSELLEGCLAHVQQPNSVPLPAALPKPAPRRAWRPPVIRSKGVVAMIAAFGAGLLGVLLLSTAPPDIAGQWSGEDWGQVVLKKTNDAEYAGTYSDTVGKQSGEIQLKWSRIERRFNGTWREGEDRFGELSVRLVGDEIRGALTTDPKSKINPATPRLADLTWIRVAAAQNLSFGPVIERVVDEMIDLDSGKLASLPDSVKGANSIVGNVLEALDWAEQAGMDAVKETSSSFLGLGMKVEAIRGDAWETATPDQLARTLAATKPKASQPMDPGKDSPATYAFQTREGGMGILQVLGFGIEGVNIRYKLVVPGGSAPLGKPKVTFGPVIERVLPSGSACTAQYFQFQKGEILMVCKGPGMTEEEWARDWKKAEDAGGVDFTALWSENGQVYLQGRGCIFSRGVASVVPGEESMAELNWNKTTAEDAVTSMKVASSDGSVEWPTRDLPITYLFKTARGETGIMQILGAVEDKRGDGGRGMKFRYKLVQQPDQVRKTGDTSKGAPAPVAITAQGGTVIVEASGSQIVADRIEIGQSGGKTTPGTQPAAPDTVERERLIRAGRIDEANARFPVPRPAEKPVLTAGWGETGTGGLRIRLVVPSQEGQGPRLTAEDFKGVLEVWNTSDKPVRLAEQNTTGGREMVLDDWLIGLWVDAIDKSHGARRFFRADNDGGYWSSVEKFSGSARDIPAGEKVAFKIELRRLVDTQGTNLLTLRGAYELEPVLELTLRGGEKDGLWRGRAVGKPVLVQIGAPAAAKPATPNSNAKAPLARAVMATGSLDATTSGPVTKWVCRAPVDEADIAAVEIGQEVHLTVDAIPRRTFQGKVAQVGKTPVAAQNAVLYETRIDIADPDPRFKLGMSANVTFIEAHRDDVLKTPDAAKASPTGESASSPRRVRRWSAGIRVGTMACSPDGKLIAVGNDQPTMILMGAAGSKAADNWQPVVAILDAKTGRPIITLKLTSKEEEAILADANRDPCFEVKALAFSPDAKAFAVGTSIGQVKLFDAQTGNLLRSFDDEQGKRGNGQAADKFLSLTRAMGSTNSLAFSPDGTLLAVCGGSFADVPLIQKDTGGTSTGHAPTAPGRLKLWDVKTGALKRDLVGHADQAEAVAFSPDGTLLASLGNWLAPGDYGLPWGVKIWDPVSGQLKRTIETHDNGGPHSVAFSPDSKLVAIGTQRFDKDKEDKDSSSGAVSLTHVASGIMEWLQTVPGWARPVAFSPDGKSVVVLSGGHAVQFLDAETGKLKSEIRPDGPPDRERWNAISVAPQANLLAIGGVDAEKRGFVEVWNLDGASADASNAKSAATPALLVQRPQLRFLAWKDEWKRQEPHGAFHADGSPVTDVSEMRLLRNNEPVGARDFQNYSDDHHPCYLHLWFSHPLCDEYSMGEVMSDDGAEQSPPPGGDIAYTFTARVLAPILGNDDQDWVGREAKAGSDDHCGWLVSTVANFTNMRPATVRLRYTLGPWEDERRFPPDRDGLFDLGNGSTFDGAGEAANGTARLSGPLAYCKIARDKKRDASRQVGVWAVTTDGRELSPCCSEFVGNLEADSVPKLWRLYFRVPLSKIAHFRIATRPVRTVEFQNVATQAKRPGPAVEAEIRFIEMPDGLPVDVAKLDLAAIEKKPGVDILSAPKVTTASGRECDVKCVSGTTADALAPAPTGVTAKLRPTLDGETVHYAVKVSISARRPAGQDERTTVQELAHSGDARLDQPMIVDIGKGEKGHRFLAWMVFHRGKWQGASTSP